MLMPSIAYLADLVDLALEYGIVIDLDYATQIARSYIDTFIPYTAVTAVSYQRLSTKGPSWMLNLALSTKSLQGLLLIFQQDQKALQSHAEKGSGRNRRRPLQLYKGGILLRNQYPRL